MSQVLTSHSTPTLAIVSDVPETGGYVVIDAADFVEGTHVLYEGPLAAAPAAPAAPEGVGTADDGGPAMGVARDLSAPPPAAVEGTGNDAKAEAKK